MSAVTELWEQAAVCFEYFPQLEQTRTKQFPLSRCEVSGGGGGGGDMASLGDASSLSATSRPQASNCPHFWPPGPSECPGLFWTVATLWQAGWTRFETCRGSRHRPTTRSHLLSGSVIRPTVPPKKENRDTDRPASLVCILNVIVKAFIGRNSGFEFPLMFAGWVIINIKNIKIKHLRGAK